MYPHKLVFVLILGLCLAACTAVDQPRPLEQPEQTLFIPPTSVPPTPAPQAVASPTSTLPRRPSPSPTLLEQVFLPSATPACVNSLRFLKDLTIPDGSRVAPGAQIDKRWLVENNGECNWDSRYRLRLIDGPDLGAPIEQALYPARSGVQATLQIIFTAPAEQGPYRSAWQAYDPQGQPFGEPIYIQILVFIPPTP